MATLNIKGLENNTIQSVEKEVVAPKAQKDALGRSYGTGRRKCSVARVWIKAGSGKVSVNGQEFETHFVREAHRRQVLQP